MSLGTHKEKMTKESIPYIIVENDGVLKPYKKISRQELEKFRELNGYLREFERSQSLLPLIKSNANELENFVEQIENKNHEIPHPRIKSIEVTDEANRLLLNFLTSCRSYIEHNDTRLKRRYGRESKQVKKFTYAKDSVEEGNFAYAFCCKLRNYVQHCGMAIDVQSNFSRSKGLSGPVDIHKMKIEFDPEKLLDNYNEWGDVKKDLKKEKGNLSVKGFAKEAFNAIRYIDSYTYLAEHPNLLEAGNWILDLIEEAFDEGENPQVGTLKKKGKILNASFTIPALDVLQTIGVVDFRGKQDENKSIEYVPMFGYCFKIEWNKEEKVFSATSPSIPNFFVQDKKREELLDKIEVKFKSKMSELLENKQRAPTPLPWREQYELINNLNYG